MPKERRNRTWGPPQTARRRTDLAGSNAAGTKGPMVFAETPKDDWTTQRLTEHILMLRGSLEDAIDPTMIMPGINYAEKILHERRQSEG